FYLRRLSFNPSFSKQLVMIPVQEALQHILSRTGQPEIVNLPLAEAYGHILAEPLVADRDFPPFDRVTMDGIAIRYADYAAGMRHFDVTGVGAAGSPQIEMGPSGTCVEIMTGAMCPAGADCIIRYEDVTFENETASLRKEAKVREGQNIHRQGSDRPQGATVVAPGQRIAAPEIGVAATVGKATLAVKRMPTAVVISSGDELVPITETPRAFQIRKSNIHRIQAILAGWGIASEAAHLLDEADQMRETLRGLLERHQMVIISGGVSKGKFDFMPQVLTDLGVEKHFHKIRQRPGKPFWFGTTPTGTAVFALPGNPVSSFMCTLRYIQPWVEASLGQVPTERYAVLGRDIEFRPELTYFAQVALRSEADGRLMAYPVEGHGSGDLANLVDADAFIELPEGKDVYKAGEVYRVFGFR
ncbi:MAG: molybdopterin molybdotransferase MoeA, partial [Bacteroidota bacterium]